MKRLLIFVGLGAAGFFTWQWVISRRTNRASREYYASTAEAQRQASATNATQLSALAALAAPFAVVKDFSGLLFNAKNTDPIMTSDGTIVGPFVKSTDDVDVDLAPNWAFGV